MKIFSPLFERVLNWSKHPKAPWYLAALSFAESSFFPIPPDVMLAPMVVAKPEAAWRLATITTVTSVVGGMLGFIIGSFAMEYIEPLLRDWGYWVAFEKSQAWFLEWGFWAVLAAGFSPIPYKIFTIAAGAMAMPFAPFVLASVVGRASRFFIVAGLLHWGGARFEELLRRYIDILGWVFVALLVAAYFLLKH
jgi:membrane protein YqaA with SNARE-associated domain